ncbi:MAG: cbb3-type cytochrome oxidase subunit 3 [Gammaproteobacteria bacterium]
MDITSIHIGFTVLVAVVFLVIVAWSYRPANQKSLERYGELTVTDDDAPVSLKGSNNE